MKDLKFLLADDHPMILKGLLSEFLANGFTNIETATNGTEALNYITDHKPDIALLDIDMPYLNGLEVAERAKGFPTKIIILTQHKEEGFLLKIKSIGAHAYLLKEDDFSEIENALESIERNKFYASSSFEDSFLEDMEEKLKLLRNLSNTELKILHLISNGLNTNEVAKHLFVSYRTVEKHRSNIIQKLDIVSQRDALNKYIQANKILLDHL
jgi:DNA-binding NarL/FixJ family response regulator